MGVLKDCLHNDELKYSYEESSIICTHYRSIHVSTNLLQVTSLKPCMVIVLLSCANAIKSHFLICSFSAEKEFLGLTSCLKLVNSNIAWRDSRQAASINSTRVCMLISGIVYVRMWVYTYVCTCVRDMRHRFWIQWLRTYVHRNAAAQILSNACTCM